MKLTKLFIYHATCRLGASTRHRVCRVIKILLLGHLLCLPVFSSGAESTSTLQEQQAVAVTIYNDNLALVKDQRKINIIHGQSALAFRDVSAQIRPETALLRSLTSPGRLSVLEQNFDFDLLTPEKLLEKYLGQSVNVLRTNPATGEESREPAQVLATNNGVVLKFADRIETGIPGRISYPHVPSNLRDRPTLVMSLDNQGSSEQNVELSYLTGGLSWQADYVAELNADDDKLDLSGWVTLSNVSGATYRNAHMQLVAGKVNRANRPGPANFAKSRVMDAMAVRSPQMAEESLLDYHLYTLDRPTTIADKQTKQVALLAASNITTGKQWLLQGGNYYYASRYGDLGKKIGVAVLIEFKNNKSAHLGLPLPKGIIRVYKKDSAGHAQFVGEDFIQHTPNNETVRLKLGESFDVTADKKQTLFKKRPGQTKDDNKTFESAYEIVLKNARKQEVTVTVREPIPGDWEVLNETHPHSKPTSNTAEWNIKIPAQNQVILSYQVLVKY